MRANFEYDRPMMMLDRINDETMYQTPGFVPILTVEPNDDHVFETPGYAIDHNVSSSDAYFDSQSDAELVGLGNLGLFGKKKAAPVKKPVLKVAPVKKPVKRAAQPLTITRKPFDPLDAPQRTGQTPGYVPGTTIYVEQSAPLAPSAYQPQQPRVGITSKILDTINTQSTLWANIFHKPQPQPIASDGGGAINEPGEMPQATGRALTARGGTNSEVGLDGGGLKLGGKISWQWIVVGGVIVLVAFMAFGQGKKKRS